MNGTFDDLTAETLRSWFEVLPARGEAVFSRAASDTAHLRRHQHAVPGI